MPLSCSGDLGLLPLGNRMDFSVGLWTLTCRPWVGRSDLWPMGWTDANSWAAVFRSQSWSVLAGMSEGGRAATAGWSWWHSVRFLGLRGAPYRRSTDEGWSAVTGPSGRGCGLRSLIHWSFSSSVSKLELTMVLMTFLPTHQHICSSSSCFDSCSRWFIQDKFLFVQLFHFNGFASWLLINVVEGALQGRCGWRSSPQPGGGAFKELWRVPS